MNAHIIRLGLLSVAACTVMMGLGLSPLTPMAQGAVTMTINSADDAYVRGGSYADNNYGADGLVVKGDNFQGTAYARKTYLSFDVSSLATYDILSAELVLTTPGHSSPPATMDHVVCGITDNSDSFSEGTITWNNAPKNNTAGAVGFLDQGATSGNASRELDVLTVSGSDAAGTEYRFEVTDFVKWALGTNPSFSDFAAKDTDELVTLMVSWTSEAVGASAHLYYSAEQSGAYQPRLEVSVPEPASATLLVCGAASLFWKRRRT